MCIPLRWSLNLRLMENLDFSTWTCVFKRHVPALSPGYMQNAAWIIMDVLQRELVVATKQVSEAA